MDYWSCALEDTGSMLSDELDFPVDAYSRNRIPLAGWEPQSGDHTGVIVDSGTNFEACARVVRSSSLMESMSSHSSSVVESNSRNAPSSDLKLGRFADSADGRNDKLSGGRLVFSASPTPHAKKARILNTRSQTPLCQVYGCNKDLSSSKDYQKRHRVCDVHSKTPRVIVNGMEQRFCQQCSRFHLLVEFDEVKRSCRRRLAGHNERRRKPHYITVAGETHRLLQSYRERYEQVNWPTRIKLEEESTTIPIASSSILPTEEFTSSSAASATNDSNRVVQSSCALSLLSADSQYFGHLDRYTTVRSLNSHPSFNYRGSNKLSAKHTSAEECVPSGSSCSKPNSNQLLHRTPLMVSSADRPEKADGPFDESNIFNTMSSHSPEEGSTVDLLQLSSHLQRVEQQRTFVQVKDEHDDFFGFRNLH